MECEALGIAFEIDHYYPRKRRPDIANEYDNLMYSCEKCNQYKSDFYPTVEHLARGCFVLRPDKDDVSVHYVANGIRIEDKTVTGRFNIELLELNRMQLRRVREIREELWQAKEYIAFGIRELGRVSIDQLDPRVRAQFLRVRKEFLDKEKYLWGQWAALLRGFGRSPLLDPDPEKKDRAKTRREYLTEIKAFEMRPEGSR